MGKNVEYFYSLAYEDDSGDTYLIECVPYGEFEFKFDMNKHGYHTDKKYLNEDLEIFSDLIDDDGEITVEGVHYTVGKEINIDSIKCVYIMKITKTTQYIYTPEGEGYEWN